jgi:hypothetical protein
VIFTKEFDKAKEAYTAVLAEEPLNRIVEMKLSNLNFAATEVTGAAQ